MNHDEELSAILGILASAVIGVLMGLMLGAAL